MADNSLVLVTGASGYIATWVVKLLQEDGWKVRGTVRDLNKEDIVKGLKELVPNAKYPLELVEADLLKEDSWKAAVQGCTHVVHLASPFPDRIPSNPDEVIKPAVDGTLAILKAVTEAGTVKRVVLTSSIAAVYDSSLAIPKDKEESKTFDEESWTNLDDPLLDPYARSKTMAEKAAWDYLKDLPDDKKFELAVVNPGMVIGPLLNKRYTTSHGIVKRLFDRLTPAYPKLNLNVTDVREVAEAHVKCLTLPEAVGKRHLIVSHNLWFREMSAILGKEYRPQGYHVASFAAPNVIVWLSSFYDKGARMVVPRLSREFKYDNKRMVDVLKIAPIDLEKTVIDTANSMIEFGVIKKSKKSKTKADDVATTSPAEGGDVKTNGDVAEPETAVKPEVAAN